ncbi:MAG: DUF1156 domain-containing protein [Chloroflexi bacterium]|nr:DUF1156 domain-containing protein [Chloroflexota bacterium]
MSERRKRLIEVAFPLEEVSAHSRREKSIRHGHISTLHIWWARRPLAACRAFIYASLVDDPDTDAERDALLREVADLANWDAVRHPDRVVRDPEDGGSGLTGAELLKRARERILACNDGKPPKLLDPFAGGGAIPLEGLRLGCEVEASDLNPVAVLILKATLEYPQKFGQADSREVPDYILQADQQFEQPGLAAEERAAEYRRNPLAADVRYWGQWILKRAREELAEFYPTDPDGRVPVFYLWSRTVPCPSCESEMPLIRQYWLARRPKKRVALQPVIDHKAGTVDFRIVEGVEVSGDPAVATSSRGDARCLICGQVVKVAQVRQACVEGKASAVLTSVVLTKEGVPGKHYRPFKQTDSDVFVTARNRLSTLKLNDDAVLPIVPDEPITFDPQNLKVRTYGMMTWGELFNERQLLALATFAQLVGEANGEMQTQGLSDDYSAAVATLLGLACDKLADYNSTLSRLDNSRESVGNTFTRQALPMVWDFCEVNPLSKSSGSFERALEWVASTLAPVGRPAAVSQRDAKEAVAAQVAAIVTDPPYYDSINYADLSDFFYVWLKRSVGYLHPDLLALPLTPKRDQTVMNVYANPDLSGLERQQAARRHYVDGMGSSFNAMAESLEPGGLTGVVFAHTDPDAWSTLIEGLLAAGLVPDASWPIDTEMETRTSGQGQARLKTSVWMVCRKQGEEPTEAFLGDVLDEMRPVTRERLLYFWGQGIRGADFFISAIGPALSVFGRHSLVLNPDGSEVSVRDFLDIVRRESTAVALEQVLQGADLGMVDSLTRQYVTWVWSYSRAALDAGEALALCLATGTRLDDVTRDHSIAVTAKQRSKKVVKLRTIAERAREDDDLGGESSGMTLSLIDQLQCAAWLWGQNQSDRLGMYRAALGESRWAVLLTLGQAVASCLPEGDEDRRIILGLLGATVRATEAPAPGPQLSLGMDEGDGTE